MTTPAPTATELEANPVVQAAFAAAWADSLVDDDVLRHEEGGYIYAALTGDVVTRRAPPGGRRGLDLTRPPVVADYFLVATYHTHPNPAARGWDPSPSQDDCWHADDSGVPWFIVSDQGAFVAGPERRVGGLSGPPGYPR
jgi:hypothetical protein